MNPTVQRAVRSPSLLLRPCSLQSLGDTQRESEMHRETNAGRPSLHQDQHLICVYVTADTCSSVHLETVALNAHDQIKGTVCSPSNHRDGALVCVMRRIWRTGAIRGGTVTALNGVSSLYKKHVCRLSFSVIIAHWKCWIQLNATLNREDDQLKDYSGGQVYLHQCLLASGGLGDGSRLPLTSLCFSYWIELCKWFHKVWVWRKLQVPFNM